jgi:hypothetical protein
MESARAWLRAGTPAVPAEIGALLESRAETRRFQPEFAIPEFVTRLDEFRGEHRNHDLIVVGEAERGRTLIAVEAKADEAFGPTVGAQLASGRKKEGSRIPDRVFALVETVFGPGEVNSSGVSERIARLRYQLITALVGTLIEARQQGADQAVFLVHEFVSEDDPANNYKGTNKRRLEANRDALKEALVALAVEEVDVPLAGPFPIHGSDRVSADMPLFVGKVSVSINPFDHVA